MKTVILYLAIFFGLIGIVYCDNDAPPAADKKAADDEKAAEKPVKPETIPRLKDPGVRTTDEIKAFFRRGIVVRGKYPAKLKQDRIYTAGELFSRFGKPDKRDSTPTNEWWTYTCADGSVTISFLNKGYGGATGAGVKNNLRLQIIGAGDMAQPRTWGAK